VSEHVDLLSHESNLYRYLMKFETDEERQMYVACRISCSLTAGCAVRC